MKFKIRRVLALSLTALIMSNSLAFASATPKSTVKDNLYTEKDETIYFQLSPRGSLEQASVVNALAPVEGKAIDYGTYQAVKNLSNTYPIQQIGDQIVTDLPKDYKGLYYYEGQLDQAKSPWNIDIGYQLDKKDIAPEDLAGQGGHLTMTVTVSPAVTVTPNPNSNTAWPNALDYTNRMTLSLVASLKTEVASLVSAPGATIVTMGGTRQINMTVLPKQTKTFVIEALVQNFEMDSMTISAVDAALGFDIDQEAASEGFTALEQGANDLTSGTEKLKTASQKLAMGSSDLARGFSTLLDNWHKLFTGLKGVETGLGTLAKEGKALSDAMTQLNQQVTGGQAQLSTADLKKMAAQLSNSQDPMVKQLAQASLAQMTLVDETQKGINQLNNALSTYTEGLQTLTGQYTQLSQGLMSFDRGLSDLDMATSTLNQGLKQLPAQIETLHSGQKDLHSGLVRAQNEIDAVMADLPDFDTGDQQPLPSFVSNKNAPSSVQFLMRTPAIEVPDQQVEAVEDEVKLSFWQRLIRLFGF